MYSQKISERCLRDVKGASLKALPDISQSSPGALENLLLVRIKGASLRALPDIFQSSPQALENHFSVRYKWPLPELFQTSPRHLLKPFTKLFFLRNIIGISQSSSRHLWKRSPYLSGSSLEHLLKILKSDQNTSFRDVLAMSIFKIFTSPRRCSEDVLKILCPVGVI